MTDEYRQKLVNWWCSMMLVWASIATGMTLFWFDGRFNPEFPAREETYMLAGMTGWALMDSIIPILPAFIWHFFDFLHRKSSTLRSSILGRFRVFGAVLAVCTFANSAIASNTLTVAHCPPRHQQFGFFHCTYGPPDWLNFAFLALLLSLLFLCMSKAVISVRSRIR